MNNLIAHKHIRQAKDFLKMPSWRQEFLKRELPKFNFELTPKQHKYGITNEMLRRVNNMAYEFIIYDGYTYEKAIGAAYLICTQCPRTPCEDDYVDVEQLLKGKKNYGFGDENAK